MRVRFAPSPTGFLHIGGARTALFNWMYAKSQNGTFILRVEDTDQNRSTKEFEEEILTSMKWLGLDWDELYFQSKRFDIYKEHAQKLLEEGKAYKEGEAIILKMPQNEEIKIYDLIRGEITFNSSDLKDQVLMKSDGSPAYSFCCVVDDALMEISHVIRGEDHISNTPKQIIIYQALGFKVPKYAHLPLIMGEDGSRLSKRNGAVAVSDYKKMGFLPEPLVNYLLLLGWSPGNDQEIISTEQAIKKFTIKKVNKAAAIFSMDKLRWVSSEYIKVMDTDKLSVILRELLIEKKLINEDFDGQVFRNIVDLYKGRLNTLIDFIDWTDFFFTDDYEIDQQLKEKHLAVDRSKEFDLLCERFSQLETFDKDSVEQAYRSLMQELNIKPGELIHPLRVSLTGKGIGPDLFSGVSLLGKEKTIERLKKAFH